MTTTGRHCLISLLEEQGISNGFVLPAGHGFAHPAQRAEDENSEIRRWRFGHNEKIEVVLVAGFAPMGITEPAGSTPLILFTGPTGGVGAGYCQNWSKKHAGFVAWPE